MHTKIINPTTHGKKVYQNTGSSARTLNYLSQEEKNKGEKTVFFGAEKEGLTSEEVQRSIDQNVKGLNETDVKFYSLVLSPSEAELRQIGNDATKLQAYTRDVMEQYAANFKLSNGRKLTSTDLVWAATIHHTRSYRGDDAEVASGEKQVGEKKAGLQTHVHIIVSARDAAQKITLNPQGQKRRFNMRDWQDQAQETFDKSFGKAHSQEQGKRTGRTSEQEQRWIKAQEEKVRVRVKKLNQGLLPEQKLDPELVIQIGMRRQYGREFWGNLYAVERKAAEGQLMPNVYAYLESTKQERQQARQAERAVMSNSQREQKLRSRVAHINSQLGTTNRLDPDRVVLIGAERKFDRLFYSNLGFIQQRAEQGRPIEHPHEYLQTGKLEQARSTTGQFKSILHAVKAVSAQTPERSRVQEIGEERGKHRDLEY